VNEKTKKGSIMWNHSPVRREQGQTNAFGKRNVAVGNSSVQKKNLLKNPRRASHADGMLLNNKGNEKGSNNRLLGKNSDSKRQGTKTCY